MEANKIQSKPNIGAGASLSHGRGGDRQTISIALVSNLRQCQTAISADVDVICVCVEQEARLSSIDRSDKLFASIGRINEILRYVKTEAPRTVRFIYGSKNDSAEFIDYVMRTTMAQGYSTGDIHEDVNKYFDTVQRENEQSANEVLKPVEAVLSYIDEHYNEKLVFSNLADMVYISRSYLSYLFKKRVGKSFSSYVAELRISKAKELFSMERYRWKTIAQMLGFPDYAHFSKTFYKQAGCWPKEYSQQQKLQHKNEK